MLAFKATQINGCYEIFPMVHRDGRGFFTETYSDREYEKLVETKFVQDNLSKSTRNVLRGLHFQEGEYAQAKLVRCVKGHVYDVAVDLRKDSDSYGKWYGVHLIDEQCNQFFIPRGCAHGFVVLSDEAIFEYKCDNDYAPGHEGGINPFDEKLNIDWIIDRNDAIMSEKDKNRENFNW